MKIAKMFSNAIRDWGGQWEEKKKKSHITISYLQLIPLTTESAISLAPSSYTCLVEQSPRNTLSISKNIAKRRQRKQLNRSQITCMKLLNPYFYSNCFPVQRRDWCTYVDVSCTSLLNFKLWKCKLQSYTTHKDQTIEAPSFEACNYRV